MTVRYITILLLVISLSPFLSMAANRHPQKRPGSGPKIVQRAELPSGNGWEWSKKELGVITRLEKRAKKVDGFYEIKGDNWTIRTRFDARFTAEASYFMELLADRVLKAFGGSMRFAVSDKPMVIIYGSAAEYRSNPQTVPGSAGVFSHARTSRGKVVQMALYVYYEKAHGQTTFTKGPMSVIQHEGTHAVTRRIFGAKDIPIWLNEGLASYFESLNVRKRMQATGNTKQDQEAKLERRMRSSRVKWLKHSIGTVDMNPPKLAYVLNLTPQTWNADGMGQKTHAHYALSESLVDFLTSSPKCRGVLMKIRTRQMRQQKPLITPLSQKKMEVQWLQFLEDSWEVDIDGVEPTPVKK